jgi:hypothetical protein
VTPRSAAKPKATIEVPDIFIIFAPFIYLSLFFVLFICRERKQKVCRWCGRELGQLRRYQQKFGYKMPYRDEDNSISTGHF